MLPLNVQLIWLLILAVPVACISWTVTHEEIFSEIHVYCANKCKNSKQLLVRKLFYLMTCEYCFSHFITIGMLALSGYKLLLDDWRSYLIAGFCMVWLANIYMSLYSILRTHIKKESVETTLVEKETTMSGCSDRMAHRSKDSKGIVKPERIGK